MFNGRRQPSNDGTSRMTRECQVRFCERLGVKFPGPTRQNEKPPFSGLCQLSRQLRTLVGQQRYWTARAYYGQGKATRHD